MTRRRKPGNRTGRFGMGNNGGELGGKRNQKSFFALIEATLLLVLHDQYAEYGSMVNDGNTEKGVELFFSGFLQIMETRVQGGILQIDRFGVLGNEANQPLAHFQFHMTDGFLAQTFGCHQDMTVDVLVQQVDGTHLRPQGFAYAMDNNIQRGLQV